MVLYRESWTLSELAKSVSTGYHDTAINCWIASLLYLTTFCVSAHQFWANYRAADDQFKVILERKSVNIFYEFLKAKWIGCDEKYFLTKQVLFSRLIT